MHNYDIIRVALHEVIVKKAQIKKCFIRQNFGPEIALSPVRIEWGLFIGGEWDLSRTI